jgi:hypothetical protein
MFWRISFLGCSCCFLALPTVANGKPSPELATTHVVALTLASCFKSSGGLHLSTRIARAMSLCAANLDSSIACEYRSRVVLALAWRSNP